MAPFKWAVAFLLLLPFQEKKGDDPARAPYLVLEDEPASFDYPDSIWFGYPSKKWEGEEKAGEDVIRKIRKEKSLAMPVVLEELRFLARGHARDGIVNDTLAHETKNWKYVSDRATVLYGWSPSEWVMPDSPFPETYLISDCQKWGFSGGKDIVDWWMNNKGNDVVILNSDVRAMGLGIGSGSKNSCLLVCAGLPKLTYDRVVALQELYAKLYASKSAAQVKTILSQILQKKEGSSFIWILSLLHDSDKEVRAAAVAALQQLAQLVPKAYGVIFGLVDLGLGSENPDVVEAAGKALTKITGRKLTKAKDWQEWWNKSWKSWGKK